MERLEIDCQELEFSISHFSISNLLHQPLLHVPLFRAEGDADEEDFFAFVQIGSRVLPESTLNLLLKFPTFAVSKGRTNTLHCDRMRDEIIKEQLSHYAFCLLASRAKIKQP